MTKPRRWLVICCVFMSGCLLPAVAQSVTLVVGAPIERELAGEQSHRYPLTLEAKQYMRGVVEQRGVDVIVSILSPEGQTLFAIDSPNGTQGPEPFFLATTLAGKYQIVVRAPEKGVPVGRYEIKLEELRPATEEDQIRFTATAAFKQADRMLDEQRAESLTKAIAKFAETLPLWEALKDVKMQARTFNNMGFAAGNLSDFTQAIRYHERALQLRHSLGDRSGEGDSLLNLATASASLGKVDEALVHYGQARNIFHELGDFAYEARVLANIGRVWSSLGEQQKAIDFLQQALSITKSVKRADMEALVLEGLGTAYAQLGDDAQALTSFEQALPLARAQKRRDVETNSLIGQGRVYFRNARQAEGLALVNQGLALCRERGNHFEEVTILSALSRMQNEMGALQQGLILARQSLEMAQQIEDRVGETGARLQLGSSQILLNEDTQARENFQTALALSRQVRAIHFEVEALYYLARLDQQHGKLTEALTQSEMMLTLLEAMRNRVTGQGLRASLMARLQQYYDFHITLLQQLQQENPNGDYAAAALYTSERARGRGLLELLNEARHDLRAGVDAELLKRERSLQQQLNDRAEKQTRLLGRKHTEEQAAAIAKEIIELTRQWQEIETQIRVTSPRYAALTQPQPLTALEIQQQLLDDDTLLLEYALGDKQSYLWVVSPQEIKSYTLPSRPEITATARKVYDQLTQPPTNSATDKTLADAQALSQILLGAAAPQLGNKRLLIVAPEILSYIPFAALPEPEQFRVSGSELRGATQPAKLEIQNSKPLIVNHEIVNLPSASVLAVLRRENSQREVAPKTVAVLADPVFETNDPRIALAKVKETNPLSNESMTNAAETDFSRAVRSMNRASLGRLAFSREEAEAIAAFTSPAQELKALSFDASRATAMSDKLSQFRIVHFATHGMLNSEHPELSGLVFSLLDEQGKSQDGFLRLHEIYNLKLPADLVVLSACQTGLGKEIKGEGVIGLTRGFMYAGAERVVASLWRVNDYATAELMKRFYKGMLKDKLRPAAALRAAQIEMWKQKRFSAPYHWAAFTLQGEWK